MEELHGCPKCDAVQFSRRDVLRVGTAVAGVAAASQFVPALVQPALGTSRNPTIWPIPTIVTRAQWGADESRRVSPATFDDVVEKIVVHHTVTQNNRSDHAAQVRNVFDYHVSHLYSDIAYNIVIDERGAIYEGRWAANYGVGAPHIGEDASLRQVRGAHALNHNARTIGVALLGTFDTIQPPPPMVDALVEVLAWKCGRWNLDPTGTSVFTDALGQQTNLPNILTHRDIRQTLCPGNATRALLPSVRTRVKTIVDARLQQARSEFWKILPGPEQRQPPG